MRTRLKDARQRHAKIRAIQAELEDMVVDYTARSTQPTLVIKLLMEVAFDALAVQTGSFHEAQNSAYEIFRQTYKRHNLCSPTSVLLIGPTESR